MHSADRRVWAQASEERFARREAPVGSRGWVQPARTLRTRLNAEGEESPRGVAHEPVRARTGGNALGRDGTHVSPMEVTPTLGKGAQDTWRFPRQWGGRLDKTGVTPLLAWRRGWGQTRDGRGVYEPAFQPLLTWKGPRKKAEVSNRTR